MRTWRTDLALNYPGAPARALVHGGFLYSYNASSLAPNVTLAVARLRQQHPDAPIYVTGHRWVARGSPWAACGNVQGYAGGCRPVVVCGCVGVWVWVGVGGGACAVGGQAASAPGWRTPASAAEPAPVALAPASAPACCPVCCMRRRRTGPAAPALPPVLLPAPYVLPATCPPGSALSLSAGACGGCDAVRGGALRRHLAGAWLQGRAFGLVVPVGCGGVGGMNAFSVPAPFDKRTDQAAHHAGRL